MTQDNASKVILDKFLDQLIKEKDLSDQDPEVTAQIRADLRELLDRKLDAVVLANLPSDSLEDFEVLVDAEDSAAIKEFISANIPNLDEVIAMGLLEFRQAYL